MSRLLNFAFASLATLFALVAILIGLLAWKMTARPLASSDLTPYVEVVFGRLAPGTKASIGHSEITWDNRKHIISIRCKEATLADEAGAMVASFPDVSFKVGIWSLLRGRVVPMEFKADHAQFWLIHHQDGSWSGGGGSMKASGGDSGTDVFGFLQDVGDELANEDLMHGLAINEAVFSVHDETIQKEWAVTAREIALLHNKADTNGEAKIEVTQGDRTAFLTARYHYDRPSREHQSSFTFQDIRLPALASQDARLGVLAAFDLPLTGTFAFNTDRALNVSSASLTIDGGAGRIVSPDMWDAPRTVRSFGFDAHFTQAKSMIEVTRCALDMDGTVLSVTGQAKTPPSRDLIWRHPRQDESFEAKVKLANLPMDHFTEVWPKLAVPNARSWMAEHMTRGRFSQGEVTLRGKIQWDDLEKSTLLSGDGKIAADSAHVTYMPGMPGIDNVSAEATFDLDHMDVKILGGHTGDIKLLPFTLRMTDFEKDTQYITIPVHLTGPTASVLKLLDSPPLGYAKAIGLSSADTGGQVEGILTLRLPMLNALLLKDVEYKADATFKDLGLKNMIPKVEVSQGNLAFHLKEDGFALEGPLALNNVPFNLVWKSAFEAKPNVPLHDAVVTGSLKDEQWAAFGLDKFVKSEGPTPLRVEFINVKKGLSRVSAEMDFKNASLQMKTIGLDKPRGVAAKLNLEAESADKKGLLIKSMSLRGQDINVRGTAELDPDTGDLRRVQLKPFILGQNDASIDILNPKNVSDPVHVAVEGKVLDISGLDDDADDKKKEPDTRGKVYELRLDKLITANKAFLTNVAVRAEKDPIGWLAIDFNGTALGETPVRILLANEGVRRKFEVSTENFGNALKGLGYGEVVNGGKLWIEGESPPDEPRVIRGKLKLTSFSVSGLPILARLLSAISPFGFVDMITGDAAFDRLQGGFKWSGHQVDLSKVRAIGSVVGINVDGHVDTLANTATLSGTVVPFSFMNSVIGSIPLLGDVITGGDGQGVLAASFTVHGALDDPSVSVNPISLLTPGFLRNLFFAGEESEEPPEKK